MEEKTIDKAAIARLAKALLFVCGAEHPTTVALQTGPKAAPSVTSRPHARWFLRLKPGERSAALAMIDSG